MFNSVDLLFITFVFPYLIGLFTIVRNGFIPKFTEQNNNVLIERPIYGIIFCFYGNLSFIGYLFINAEFKLEIPNTFDIFNSLLISLFILFTSYIILEVKNYKVIFNKDSIQVNTFYGRKRKFTWDDIRAIEFSSTLNSIVIYYGNNSKTLIYMNTFNIAYFVQVMKEQINEEQYNNVIKGMNKFYKMWFINPSKILDL